MARDVLGSAVLDCCNAAWMVAARGACENPNEVVAARGVAVVAKMRACGVQAWGLTWHGWRGRVDVARRELLRAPWWAKRDIAVGGSGIGTG